MDKPFIGSIQTRLMVETQLQVLDSVVPQYGDNAVLNSNDFIQILACLLQISTLEVVGKDAINKIVFLESTISYKGLLPKCVCFSFLPSAK